ncbi:hypothetical protein Tco_0518109 [Tanacetum coccineum]
MVQKPVLNNVKNGTGQREVIPVWNNAVRVNHQNFSNFRRNFVPTTVLTKSGIVSVSVARPINTTAPKSFVNVNTAKINSVNTAKGNKVTSAVREQGINVVKSSVCWVWRPKINVPDQVSKNSGSYISLELKGYLMNNGFADLVKMLYVDGQTIAITKASVRRHLQLADADGISSLSNTEIFDQLTLMGYVSNDDKLTFQKGGHTPGSDEDSKKLNELTELCTKLSDKVTMEDDLKQTKKIYGKALTKLVKKVKHLEAKLKSTTERRKARMVISNDEEDLVSEDTSKQGRMTETEYEGFTLQLFTPRKVTQGEEQCQESSEAQLSVLSAAKILVDASRERVKTYTRRRSIDSSRDSTVGGLFSTAEEGQGKEHISTDKKEMARATAREEQERIDFKKALELQKQLDEKEETDNIDWNTVAEQVQERQSSTIKRTAEALRSEPIQEQPTEEPKELSEEELKNMMEIVPVEEIKAEALQVKYPIINWEIHTEGSRKYWKIIRVRNITEAYQVFEDMLKGFDREDLRLFEPDKDDVLWKLQRYMYDPLTWRLYGTCGVHHVSSTKGHDIYMLIEKDYPLSTEVMNLMLSRRLQVEEDSEMAKDLIKKIFIEANKPRR